MAYIGHSASGNFTTKPAKDTFSGDGSTTAFTLSEGATTNTVDVFVENVRQEPTTAYTVSGTTLTFTAAPGSGTNNIYVVNRGPLQLSATHPAAQALEASTGAFTGDLTVDTNTLHVDSTNNRVGVGTTAPETPVEIRTTNKLGGTFTGTVDGEGLRVTQTDYTSGNYVSLVEAPFDDSQTAANVRIAGMFDGGGSNLAFGTSNSYGSGITNTAMFIHSSGNVQLSGALSFGGNDVETAANALDDYEEGTWTPTAGSNVSAISSAGGFYTKVGNLVTVSFIATLTPTGTGSAMVLGGLPYAVADKLSGTQAEATGVVFEDASLFLSLALGASSNLHIEFDRPIQGSTPSIQEIYRGTLAYFTT